MSTSVIILNAEVESYVRKHGEPLGRKPHGKDLTVLYYQSEDSDQDAGDRLLGADRPVGGGLFGKKPGSTGSSS